MRIAVMIGVALLSVGCMEQNGPMASTQDLVFLTRGGCVNTATMKTNLDDALRLSGQPSE